jgi:DNA polymerase-3 subunit gamma/tau
MSYICLYRKYRPQVFKDVVGQNNIVKILTNSIKLNQIHNSYIFFGPKGCGKTSIAKMYAKAINCIK